LDIPNVGKGVGDHVKSGVQDPGKKELQRLRLTLGEEGLNGGSINSTGVLSRIRIMSQSGTRPDKRRN